MIGDPSPPRPEDRRHSVRERRRVDSTNAWSMENVTDPYRSSYGEGDIWHERLAVMRRYKWLVLAVGVAGVALGYWRSTLAVPTYEATAILRVRSPDAGYGALPGLTPASGSSDMLTELEMLRSRQTARVVADSLRLTTRAEPAVRRVLANAELTQGGSAEITLVFGVTSYSVARRNGDGPVSAPYGQPLVLPDVRLTVRERPVGVERSVVRLMSPRAAAELVQANLKTRIRGATEIVDLSFTAADPELAADVVNTTARLYQQQNVEQASRRARVRRTFIATQLARADSVYTAARNELNAFRRETGVLNTEAELDLWHQSMLQLESERLRLVSDREILGSIVAAIDADSVTDSDLQALVYAPVVSDNAMVATSYARYQELVAERDALVAGPFGEAESSPTSQKFDLLIRAAQEDLLAASRNLTQILDARIAAADERLRQSRAQLGDLPAEATRENELLQRLQASGALVESLRDEFLRAQIAEVEEGGAVDIVDLASVPEWPRGSRGPPAMLIGLMLGLAAGVAGAFALDRLDTRLKETAQLGRALHVPGLGLIPLVPRGDRLSAVLDRLPGRHKTGVAARNGNGLLLINGEPAVPQLGEAYRSLRTNLMFSLSPNERHVLLITSAHPGEGKTTTALNLATVFAHQKIRTLLVDADLRNPNVHRLCATRRTPGLSDVVLEESDFGEAVCKTDVDGLYVLPAGRQVFNSSEILGSERFRDFIQSARDRFDFVIFDSPPVLAFTDAAILGALVDGVILVVWSDVRDQRDAQVALAQLHGVGARVIGGLVNGSSQRSSDYDYYYASAKRAERL